MLSLLQQPCPTSRALDFRPLTLPFFWHPVTKKIHGQVGDPVRIQVIYKRRYWRRCCSEMLRSWQFKILYFCLILINSLVFRMKCVQFVHSVETVTLQDQLYT